MWRPLGTCSRRAPGRNSHLRLKGEGAHGQAMVNLTTTKIGERATQSRHKAGIPAKHRHQPWARLFVLASIVASGVNHSLQRVMCNKACPFSPLSPHVTRNLSAACLSGKNNALVSPSCCKHHGAISGDNFVLPPFLFISLPRRKQGIQRKKKGYYLRCHAFYYYGRSCSRPQALFAGLF